MTIYKTISLVCILSAVVTITAAILPYIRSILSKIFKREKGDKSYEKK